MLKKQVFVLILSVLAGIFCTIPASAQKKRGPVKKKNPTAAQQAAAIRQQQIDDSLALARQQFVLDSTARETARLEDSARQSLATPVDSTNADTTLVDQLVDSVVAQFKAPIVQVPVTPKSLIIPGLFFGYGVFTLNSRTLQKVNREVKTVVWDPHQRDHWRIEDYTLLVPAATVYALNIAGFKGHNNLIDRSIIYGMANLVNNGLSFGIKKFGIETRPDSSDSKSFPSGHTSQAFVSAEFARQEYRGISPWPGIFGYSIAVGTAYMRMYHNKHWLGDVVAGAGVGIFSTRISYYLYPLFKHLIFGSEKIKGDAMILPIYNQGTFGLAGVWNF